MRALLIDLDDTLLDETTAATAAFETLCATHSGALNSRPRGELLALWRDIGAQHWGRFERSEMSFQDHRRDRIRDFLKAELDDAAADAAFEPYWREYERSWRLFPDVLPFLEQTRHLPKVIVTNGERPQQMQKIAATGLAEHVGAVVTPTDCGFSKPDVEIFSAALRTVGLPPESCMMIGDDLARDIAPARALGMRCFHVDRSRNRGLAAVMIEGATMHPRHKASISLTPAQPGDAQALATLRVEAMRESLERIGRFDPVRARDRFLSGFSPRHTRHIEADGRKVGFVVAKPQPDCVLLDHLYIHPESQGRNIGTTVLFRVIEEAAAMGLPVRVGALRGSDSNRFYARHGFELVEQAEFDNYYIRP